LIGNFERYAESGPLSVPHIVVVDENKILRPGIADVKRRPA